MATVRPGQEVTVKGKVTGVTVERGVTASVTIERPSVVEIPISADFIDEVRDTLANLIQREAENREAIDTLRADPLADMERAAQDRRINKLNERVETANADRGKRLNVIEGVVQKAVGDADRRIKDLEERLATMEASAKVAAHEKSDLVRRVEWLERERQQPLTKPLVIAELHKAIDANRARIDDTQQRVDRCVTAIHRRLDEHHTRANSQYDLIRKVEAKAGEADAETMRRVGNLEKQVQQQDREIEAACLNECRIADDDEDVIDVIADLNDRLNAHRTRQDNMLDAIRLNEGRISKLSDMLHANNIRTNHHDHQIYQIGKRLDEHDHAIAAKTPENFGDAFQRQIQALRSDLQKQAVSQNERIEPLAVWIEALAVWSEGVDTRMEDHHQRMNGIDDRVQRNQTEIAKVKAFTGA